VTAPDVFDTRQAAPAVHTLEQVAERLQVSADTVRREIRRGRLTAVRIGNRIRVTETQLARYLEREDQQ
jgi:excisionase family DNA binding protein